MSSLDLEEDVVSVLEFDSAAAGFDAYVSLVKSIADKAPDDARLLVPSTGGGRTTILLLQSRITFHSPAAVKFLTFMYDSLKIV